MDAVTHLVSDPLLLLHVLASVLSLALAPINLLRRRRDRIHRRIGRTWWVTMFITALTSFSIQDPFLGVLLAARLVPVDHGVARPRRRRHPPRQQARPRRPHGRQLRGTLGRVHLGRRSTRPNGRQVIAEAPLTAAVTGLLAALTAVGAFWTARTVPTQARTRGRQRT